MLRRILVLSTLLAAVAASSVARAAQDPYRALVTRIVRRVQWERQDTAFWQKAHLETLLLSGDAIRTGEDSRVELTYGDGTVTRLGSLSAMTLNGASKRVLHLESGRIWLHVKKHSVGMRIVTPSAVAAVTGTELMVEYDRTLHRTQVTVFEGSVDVTGDVGHLVSVIGGETTQVLERRPAAPPVPLGEDKLLERARIDKPLGPEPSVLVAPNVGASAEPTEPPNPASTLAPDAHPSIEPGPTAAPSTAPSIAPSVAPSVQPTVAPAKPETRPQGPDIKGQTDKLLDPRLMNGSPTTGSVRVIIK